MAEKALCQDLAYQSYTHIFTRRRALSGNNGLLGLSCKACQVGLWMQLCFCLLSAERLSLTAGFYLELVLKANR